MAHTSDRYGPSQRKKMQGKPFFYSTDHTVQIQRLDATV